MGAEKTRVVVIAGPTASGKTRVGVELALALQGEVVNADSMQVYRGMDIGTAKPTRQERMGVPHHLLDVVAPDEEFNASRYREMALPLVEDIDNRGKACLVVGGTGLYIKALVQGLFHCPPADLGLRESLRRECKRVGTRKLHERLKALDPEAGSRIHPNDAIRIVRALEIIRLTNRPFSALAKEHAFRDMAFETLRICLHVEREKLYGRINDRSLAMVEGGLPGETANLLSRGYSPDLKPMMALGYRHMVKYLDGLWSLEEAVGRLQRDTRRYAKRQLTWFRRDPGFIWIRPEETDTMIETIKSFVRL